MFKLWCTVLLAVLSAVAAEPGYFVPAPLTYTSTYVSPSTTTISQQASSVVHPSPVYTSAFPYAHFIKKRSAPLFTAPGYFPSPYYAHGSYIAPAYAKPLVSTYSYATPYVHYAAPYATHLIKKRSAPVIAPVVAPGYIAPASYIPTTYATAPFYSSAYATPYYSSPYYASAYSPFYIKK